jgi:hypothetical protein
MEGKYNMAKQKPYEEQSIETPQGVRDMLIMFNYSKLSRVIGLDYERIRNLATGRSKKIKIWELKLLQRFIEDCLNAVPPEEYW